MNQIKSSPPQPIESSNPESRFRSAFAKAKKAFRPVLASTENSFFKSKYASLADYHHAVDEALLENGFTLHQLFKSDGDGNYLVTKLAHVGGHSEVSTIRLMEAADPQKMGSQLTYMRRYSLAAILGVPSEDDDGNTASEKPAAKPSTPGTFKTITGPQANRFNAIARQNKWSQPQIEALLNSRGYGLSTEIKPADYDALCAQVGRAPVGQTHKDLEVPPYDPSFDDQIPF